MFTDKRKGQKNKRKGGRKQQWTEAEKEKKQVGRQTTKEYFAEVTTACNKNLNGKS